MPIERTDSQGYSTSSEDVERDMGAKGGPTTSLGSPDDKHSISHPYDADTQTQLAAHSHKSKENVEKASEGGK